MGITKIKLKKEELVKIVAATFPECTLADYEELTEGLCNTAYRMVLSNGQKVVFRRSWPGFGQTILACGQIR